MAKRGNTNKINFLGVNKDGYLYKKTDEAAYNESKEQGLNNVIKYEDKEGKVYYHDVFTQGTEDGYISHMGIREANFPNGVKQKQFYISVKGKAETDSISFSLYNTKGNLNNYVKHFACVLPNLDYSRKVNIVPSTKKDERGFVDQTVFINYKDTDDNEFVRLAHKYGDDGDIPAVEKEEGIDGKSVSNFKKQDKYLYGILTQEIERFNQFKSNADVTTPQHSQENEYSNTEQPEPSVVKSESPEDVIKEIPKDDLPF